MGYSNEKYERQSGGNGVSNSYSSARQVNVVKRLFVLLMMAMCLMFAGTQSAPTARASAGCELVCGDPFIDPNDGQCYVMCCPADKECARACELRPCQ